MLIQLGGDNESTMAGILVQEVGGSVFPSNGSDCCAPSSCLPDNCDGSCLLYVHSKVTQCACQVPKLQLFVLTTTSSVHIAIGSTFLAIHPFRSPCGIARVARGLDGEVHVDN